jgi:hypothetical protein
VELAVWQKTTQEYEADILYLFYMEEINMRLYFPEIKKKWLTGR